MTTFRLLAGLLFVSSFVLLEPVDAFAQIRGTGVVILHGKAGPGPNLQPLAAALSAEGALVATPRMSWTSGYRTYEETLREVDAQVAALRRAGASRIVVAGHSLGANVALGYAASRGGVAGLVLMAPGHRPENLARATRDSLQRAKSMLASGRGSETARFVDVNQGDVYEVRTTAAAYASFFDPAGPAVFSRNAARLGNTPVLWVVGSDDPNARAAVARGGRSRTVTVAANHRRTPRAGVREIMSWLRSL